MDKTTLIILIHLNEIIAIMSLKHPHDIYGK
jgi:hypothetical protein